MYIGKNNNNSSVAETNLTLYPEGQCLCEVRTAVLAGRRAKALN